MASVLAKAISVKVLPTTQRVLTESTVRIETKGNIFIKDSNLTARRLTQQVTLKHNSALYNKNGKRIGKKVLPKGESYFIYGTRRIQGRKYYQVGDKEFIKASNASTPFSTYHQDNNVDNGNSNTTDTSTNTNISTVTNYNNASSTTNNSQQSQQTQSGSNTTINVGGGDNEGSQTSKPSTNTNNGNHSSNNQGHSSSTTPDHTYRNYVELPGGYLETVKKADWKKTEVPDDLIRKGIDMNTFHSESKADDEMKIDSAKLTPSQSYEINDFALRLINHVREQNGQKPWYYSNISYAIAKRVAYLYEQDHMGLPTWHDQKALNEIDKEAGINSAELIVGDVVAMLFSTVELEHAHIMLTWNSTTNSTTYMGLAISWQEKNKLGYQEHSDHFIAY